MHQAEKSLHAQIPLVDLLSNRQLECFLNQESMDKKPPQKRIHYERYLFYPFYWYLHSVKLPKHFIQSTSYSEQSPFRCATVVYILDMAYVRTWNTIFACLFGFSSGWFYF